MKYIIIIGRTDDEGAGSGSIDIKCATETAKEKDAGYTKSVEIRVGGTLELKCSRLKLKPAV